MTQSDKLQALIQKAIENGWDVPPIFSVIDNSNEDVIMFDITFSADEEWAGWEPSLNTVLFSHDFARALFGEESDGTEFVEGMFGEQPKLRWKYHLQQAVISEDPIDYMYGIGFDA